MLKMVECSIFWLWNHLNSVQTGLLDPVSCLNKGWLRTFVMEFWYSMSFWELQKGPVWYVNDIINYHRSISVVVEHSGKLLVYQPACGNPMVIIPTILVHSIPYTIINPPSCISYIHLHHLTFLSSLMISILFITPWQSNTTLWLSPIHNILASTNHHLSVPLIYIYIPPKLVGWLNSVS